MGKDVELVSADDVALVRRGHLGESELKWKQSWRMVELKGCPYLDAARIE